MDGERSERERREILVHYDEIADELWRIVGCPHLAADLAQETFRRALSALGRRGPPRHALPWLRAISRNAIRDHFRKSTRRPIAVDPKELELLVGEKSESEPRSPEGGITVPELARALDDLPEVTRALVVGFYFDGKALGQLSVELGIGRELVKVKLYRAREKLRARLIKVKEARRGATH